MLFDLLAKAFAHKHATDTSSTSTSHGPSDTATSALTAAAAAAPTLLALPGALTTFGPLFLSLFAHTAAPSGSTPDDVAGQVVAHIPQLLQAAGITPAAAPTAP